MSSRDRSSALHQRAVSRAEAALADPEPAAPHRGAVSPAAGRRPSLPGAGGLAIGLVGVALGLAATAVVVDRGWDPGAAKVGSWTTRPRVGTPGIDPYARAELARSGAVPIASGEGMSLVATTDDTGYQLLLSCTYRLGGAMPAARFWTLTATGPDGKTMDNPALRTGFTSTTVIRNIVGKATLDIGPAARSGNWLPLSGTGPLTLTLRLYDTPLAGTSGDFAGAALPTVTRQSCESPAAGPVR